MDVDVTSSTACAAQHRMMTSTSAPQIAIPASIFVSVNPIQRFFSALAPPAQKASSVTSTYLPCLANITTSMLFRNLNTCLTLNNTPHIRLSRHAKTWSRKPALAGTCSNTFARNCVPALPPDCQ